MSIVDRAARPPRQSFGAATKHLSYLIVSLEVARMPTASPVPVHADARGAGGHERRLLAFLRRRRALDQGRYEVEGRVLASEPKC